MRPQVTFRSESFNTSQPREYFINPDCFGDDVAAWLIGELQSRGIDVDAQAGQEDFGWYVRYRVNALSHCFVLALIPADGGERAYWAGWFERDAGPLATLLGGRKRGIALDAIRVVRDILESSPLIRDMEWVAGSA